MRSLENYVISHFCSFYYVQYAYFGVFVITNVIMFNLLVFKFRNNLKN
jgi:hypothetical protein